MPVETVELLKTKLEEVVVPFALEVKVWAPVPEVKFKAVAPVALPVVIVLALAPVPIEMLPVVPESIEIAPVVPEFIFKFTAAAVLIEPLAGALLKKIP